MVRLGGWGGGGGGGVVQPMHDRQHQPLQREDGGSREQRRQRAVRDLAQQVAARAGEIEPAELQDVVAPVVVELAFTELIVDGVAMLWRDVERLLQRVAAAGI